MELISKQSKDIMGQELLVKMTVADLVILDSILANQSDNNIMEALHWSSTGCQSSEWHIYNGEQGVYEYMNKNPESHYENIYNKVNNLMREVFNIQDY